MQLRTSHGTPPFDLFLGDGYDAVSLIAGGRFLPLTADKVPNIKDVYEKFKKQFNGFAALFDYASVGIAYSTERIKNPPVSWREFIDRTAAGDFDKRVFFNGFPGVRGPEVLMALSRVFGGDPEKIDAGFAAIKRIRPYVFKFFTSFNDPVQLIMTGEGDIGPGWDGRTFIAHDQSGGKINWIDPKEGAAAGGPIVAVVKGGNSDGAYALINYALGAEAQKAFCEAMGYGAVNSKVVYSERLAKRIPSAQNALVADDRFIATHLGAWVERWNREIA
jgi:putative spermidine/putrescine transport system substrate-binding protein